MKQIPITQAVKIARKRVQPFNGGRRYLSTGDLNVNVIKKLEPVTYEERPSRADLIVDTGDLIVARMQATKKVMLISEEESDVIVSTGFLTLEAKEGWDNDFLYFYFNSPNFQDQKDRLCTGATQKAINNAKFKEITIPEISLDDQKELVKSLLKADEVGKKRRKSLQLMEDYSQSLFDEMFGDPVLNEKGWDLIPLTEIGKYSSGGTPSKQNQEYWRGKFPWVSPKDMKTPYIYDSQNHISEKVFEETSLKIIPQNCLLIVVRGMILAHSFPTAINKVKISINQDMKAIELGENLLPVYTKKALDCMKSKLLSSISTAAHGTKRFDKDSMKKVLVPVPPLNLQKSFVSIIETQEKTKKIMEKQSQELEANFNALIQSAFSK